MVIFSVFEANRLLKQAIPVKCLNELQVGCRPREQIVCETKRFDPNTDLSGAANRIRQSS